MAFMPHDLSVLAYANGFTLWHYASADADTDAAGYFDPAADLLRAGDMILATTSGTPPRGSILLVTAATAGGVTVGGLLPS